MLDYSILDKLKDEHLHIITYLVLCGQLDVN